MNAAQNVSEFLVQTIFTLYVGALFIRILLAATRADFYNPFSQFIVTITNPVIIPARKLIPSIRQFDIGSWLVTYLINLIKLFLIAALQSYSWPLGTLLIYSIVDLAILLITILVWIIIILALMSWVAGSGYYQNPVVSILHSISDPLIRPVRRMIPPIGMIDLSPMIVIIGLYCILIVLKSLFV